MHGKRYRRKNPRLRRIQRRRLELKKFIEEECLIYTQLPFDLESEYLYDDISGYEHQITLKSEWYHGSGVNTSSTNIDSVNRQAVF